MVFACNFTFSDFIDIFYVFDSEGVRCFIWYKIRQFEFDHAIYKVKCSIHNIHSEYTIPLLYLYQELSESIYIYCQFSMHKLLKLLMCTRDIGCVIYTFHIMPN